MKSLNPLKRVNSILTELYLELIGLNVKKGLNPLKRVNSILTETPIDEQFDWSTSQSPQAGQFNSYSGVFK